MATSGEPMPSKPQHPRPKRRCAVGLPVTNDGRDPQMFDANMVEGSIRGTSTSEPVCTLFLHDAFLTGGTPVSVR